MNYYKSNWFNYNIERCLFVYKLTNEVCVYLFLLSIIYWHYWGLGGLVYHLHHQDSCIKYSLKCEFIPPLVCTLSSPVEVLPISCFLSSLLDSDHVQLRQDCRLSTSAIHCEGKGYRIRSIASLFAWLAHSNALMSQHVSIGGTCRESLATVSVMMKFKMSDGLDNKNGSGSAAIDVAAR